MEGENHGVMNWADYVDLLKPAEQLLAKTLAPHSAQQRAELWKQFAMNLSQGYFLLFQSDPDHPDWSPFENSVFMLQPNPDGVYFYAPVRGDGVYRVIGERGNAPVVGFTTGKNMIGIGDPPGPGYNNYDADDLTLDGDGRFEVIFSSERPEGHSGDWRYLHPDAKFILVRQFSYDWGKERDVRLAIERIGSPTLKPYMTAEYIDRTLRQLFGSYTALLSRQCMGSLLAVRDKGAVNKMELSTFQEMGNSGDWPQAYWRCVYDIQADEALILETELPEKRHYWNVQVIDSLWNQVECLYRNSSLNAHQASIDSDGKFRAVLAVTDPGVKNWLDTGGFLQGMLIGRWYRCSSHPLPSLTKVKLNCVRDLLPADTAVFTPEQRSEQMRVRRIGAQLRRRW